VDIIPESLGVLVLREVKEFGLDSEYSIPVRKNSCIEALGDQAKVVQGVLKRVTEGFIAIR